MESIREIAQGMPELAALIPRRYRPRGTPTVTLQATVHMDSFQWLFEQAKAQHTSLGVVLDKLITEARKAA